MIVVYLFFVAVANVAVGFLLAAYLGRCYARLAMADAWAAVQLLEATRTGYQPRPVDAGQGGAESEVEHGQLSNPTSESPSASPTVQLPTLLHDLRIASDHFADRLTAADDQLRRFELAPDATAIDECVHALTTSAAAHMESINKPCESLVSLLDALSPANDAQSLVRIAVQIQASEVQSLSHRVAEMNYEGDLQRICRQVLGHVYRLVHANHQFRDALEEAAAPNSVATGDSPSPTDESHSVEGNPLAGTFHRAGMEMALQNWWREDPSRMRRLAVGMVDLDHFGTVNERFGCRTGEEILRRIGNVLEGERRAEAGLIRLSGQRFLFLFPDTDLCYASNVMERARLKIERTQFRVAKENFSLTVSCSVLECHADDSTLALLARAEATLLAAKRCGRNRTFLDDNGRPTPVTPPNFSLEETQITLD